MAEWSEERTELLLKLWADGWSGGSIAARLGATRCAVLGKANRLGLCRETVAAKALELA